MSQKRSHTSYQNGSKPTVRPDPEVVAQAKRRTFTAAYKLGIVEEADQCGRSGQVGALLRREGLYSSHLTTCRRCWVSVKTGMHPMPPSWQSLW